MQEAIKWKKEKKREKYRLGTEESKKEYIQANKLAKKAVARAKWIAYRDMYKSLEEQGGVNTAIRIAKCRKKRSEDVSQIRCIKNKDGEVLLDDDKIKGRWKEYFEELLNVENDRIQRDVQQREIRDVQAISEEEVRDAMRKMKNNKAVGPDNIPIEAWKCLGREGIEWLTKLYGKVWETGKMPDEWRKSVLVPIFKKKGDIQECKNYRGIKLMSHTMKLLERIIDRRLREEVGVSKEQFGFMPGRSTSDPIFSIRQLIEKHREGNTNLHLVFIDLEKAYDRIPRSEVWNCLRIKKVPEKYIKVIQDMYKDSETQIRTPAGRSESFTVTVGVHRGSALSPFIFTIVMDTLTDNIRKRAPENMMFADDVILCGKERQAVEDQLEGWRRSLEDYGLKVSREKTEYLKMQAGHRDEGEIELRGVKLKRVSEFKYLGSTLQEDGGASREVERRIAAGWHAWKNMSGILCDKRVPLYIKGNIYKVVVRPALLYGTEALPITKCQEKKANTAEMRMLRWMRGITRKDRVENVTVRKELGVEKVSEKMRENRLRWFGHVWRSEEQGLTKRVMGIKVGRRSRGRPKRRFMACIEEDLKIKGLEVTDAEDRDLWRRKIRTGDPD